MLTVTASSAQKLRWPDGKLCVVCLTHDDGLPSQLDRAIPALDKHGFKATFFLKGDVPASDFKRWASAAASGHELGNHSFTHPCYSGYAFAQASGSALDKYSPQQLTGEIARMNGVLLDIDLKAGPRVYAYPCYNRALINGYFGMTPLADGSSAIEAVRSSGLISFARGGDPSPVVTQFAKLDLMYVPSVMFPGGTADELLRYVDEAAAKRGLVVLSLHDVGGPTLSISVGEYARLLDALAARPEIWVARFGEAMAYVQHQVAQGYK